MPVLSRYQAMLGVCAEFSGDSYLVGGVVPTRKNVTTPVLARASGGVGLKRLSVSRLRSTWLARSTWSASACTVCWMLAGLESSQRLFDLACSIPALSESELVVLLGGAS